jgi:hypothetical protein
MSDVQPASTSRVQSGVRRGVIVVGVVHRFVAAWPVTRTQ